MGNEQQHYAACHANGLPARLAMLDPILSRDVQWIVEYELGGLKADAVFALVAFVLGVIP